MRFYDLVISDPVSKLVWQPSTTQLGLVKAAGGSTFTSYVNGSTLFGALNIEFDFPVYPFANPQGNAGIRVWGVGLPMIGQAAQLAGQNFTLSAGMKQGLPLAKPAQANVIATGTIYKSFGNWQGTNQTLDLVVYPSSLVNIAWKWPKGTSLQQAVQNALSAAFPTVKNYTFNISSGIVQDHDDGAQYYNLAQFATHILEVTQAIGANVFKGSVTPYPGVQIGFNGDTFSIYDTQGAAPVTELAFEDLIGQPTWIDYNTVSFKTVLRADLSIGSKIKFPSAIVTPYALTSPNAAFPNAPAASKIAFQSTFLVNEVHHFANFRQPDADSWNTSFTAFQVAA